MVTFLTYGLVYVAMAATALAYSLHFSSLLHAKEVALGLCACAAGFVAIFRGGMSRAGFRAFAPLWVLAAYALLVHVLLGAAQMRTESLHAIARWILLLLFATAVFDWTDSEAGHMHVRRAIVLSAFAAAVLGLAQYTGLLPFLFPAYEGTAQRMYSVFGNRVLFGGYLAAAIPLVWPREPSLFRRSWIDTAVLMILVVALALSASRSAWLSAILGVALGASTVSRSADRSGSRARTHRASIALALTGLAAMTLLVAPHETRDRIAPTFGDADAGWRLRLWFWDGVARMARDHALIGAGPGNFAYWSPRYLGEALWAPGGERHMHNETPTLHAHCSPLEAAAELGIPGIVCMLWMLVRLARRPGLEWGSLAALLTFSLFNPVFHSPPHALAALLLAACLLGSRHAFPDQPEARDASSARGQRTAAIAATLVAALLAGYLARAVAMPSWALRSAEDLYVTRGASGETIAAYECAVAIGAGSLARKQMGVVSMERGALPEARDHLMAALDGLDTGDLYLSLAATDYALGNWAEAHAWARQCLLRWPSNRDAWRVLVQTSPVEEREEIQTTAERWLDPAAIKELFPASSSGARGESPTN